MFPRPFAMRTLVLTSGAVVSEVVIEIFSRKLSKCFTISLALVGTGQEGVVT